MLSLCLACAAVADRLIDEAASCAECGAAFDLRRYQTVESYARRTVRYGFQYRVRHESDVRAGVKNRYAIAPLSDVYTFVGLAMLSGVLGNAAYDAVKVAIRRILQSYPDLDDRVKAQIENELATLEEYLIDFATRPRVLPDSVLRPVLEEATVDLAEELTKRDNPDYMEEFIASSSDSTKVTHFREAQARRLREAALALPQHLTPPPETDWNDLWRNAGQF